MLTCWETELAEEEQVERSASGHGPAMRRLRGKWERETNEPGGPSQVETTVRAQGQEQVHQDGSAEWNA